MPSIRRVTVVAGKIEYAPAPVRRVTTVAVMIEYVEEQPAARWVGLTDYARPVMIGVQGVKIS